MDQQVEQVVVCGSSSTADQVDGLAEELGIPVTMFDPATSAPSNMNAAIIPPESLARFSAVLGMALGEADRRPPIVDFINVRRKAEPRQFTRVHALAAAAAGIAVLALLGSMWLKSSRAASQLAEIRAEIQTLKESGKQFEEVVASAEAVERWLATDVNWLDELEMFGRRLRPKSFAEKDFPVNDDVVVTQLTLVRPQGTQAQGGRMGLQAVAKSQAAVAKLGSRLSDANHRVDAGGGQQETSVPGYKWGFNLDVHVKKTDDAVEAAKP
jgi:hypothetical protein